MRLRNTNPLGAVDLPLIGRTLAPGEEFDVPDVQGAALLEQVGNYEPVVVKPGKPAVTTTEESA